MNSLKKLYYIIFFVFAIVFISYFIYKKEKEGIEYYKLHKERQYSGTISKKFIDKVNHGYETIIITTSNGDSTIVWDSDRSGLFEYVQLGDSLVKLYNSYEIQVYRNSKLIKSFFMDWGYDKEDLRPDEVR